MPSTKTAAAEALGRAHKKLLKDLPELERAADPNSGEGPAKLRSRLGVLRTHLVEHFRFEEQGGLHGAVVGGIRT